MTGLIVAEKRCTRCGETKPLTDFYRNRAEKDGRNYRCKPCVLAEVKASAAKRRALIGDDAYLASRRLHVRLHRAVTGNAQGKAYGRARRRAIKRLIEAHRSEFDRLLAAERYEEDRATS